MILDTARLLTFFLTRYLEMKPRREQYWRSAAPSDEELEERLEHLAGMTLMLLGNGDLGRHEVEDIMWVISEYCHRELDIPIRLDVAHHMAQAARTEPALHLLNRFYRDHFFHALDVCLIGHFLLETDWGSGPLWQTVAHALQFQGQTAHTREKVLRLWYVSSLLHDVGYGVEVLKGTLQLLRFFQNTALFKTFTGHLQKCLDGLSESMAEELWEFRHVEKAGEDHGLIAGRHLKGLLERIARDDPSVNPADYQHAIRAIARHNHRGKERVTFATEPLAFLLILCDTIQEWDRPRLTYETAPQVMLSWLRQQRPEEVQTGGPLDTLWVSAEPAGANAAFRLSPPGRLHLTLEFDHRINVNDAVFFVWLDASSNLQRLDFTGLDTDIELEYVTPMANIRFQHAVHRQFHRLRDAARETHMGFLERWFPTMSDPDRRATNGAVTYWLQENRERDSRLEHVQLNLRELSRQQPITKDIGEFFRHIARWQCYNDNRTFIGDYGLPESPY